MGFNPSATHRERRSWLAFGICAVMTKTAHILMTLRAAHMGSCRGMAGPGVPLPMNWCQSTVHCLAFGWSPWCSGVVQLYPRWKGRVGVEASVSSGAERDGCDLESPVAWADRTKQVAGEPPLRLAV